MPKINDNGFFTFVSNKPPDIKPITTDNHNYK